MPRAVLVDDERLARRELRALLRAHPEVQVVGEAETVQGAAEAVHAAEADTVFLDIELGSESGFDLLPRLDPGVSVVFVTAYDQHAVRAFEMNALDYLLKPVSPARLAESLQRLAGEGDLPRSEHPETVRYEDFLFLRVDGRMRFVKVRDIAAIEADADHTRLRLASGESLRVRKTMGDWEARLPGTDFVRIHRSAMANVNCVERVEDWFGASFLVYLRGTGEPLRMSRRYASLLRERRG